MSTFSERLAARREALGLSIDGICSQLNRKGIEVAYSTVAGWFNGSRGGRWRPEELDALLQILQTDFESMVRGRTSDQPEQPPLETARLMRQLDDAPTSPRFQ